MYITIKYKCTPKKIDFVEVQFDDLSRRIVGERKPNLTLLIIVHVTEGPRDMVYY